MTEYLKKSAKDYLRLTEDRKLIYPISEIDGEIITEIYEIIKKAGIEDVAKILKKYKFLKDEEIRDQLLQFNIDNRHFVDIMNNSIDQSLMDDMVEEKVQEKEEEYKKTYIDFEGKMLNISNINSVEKRNESKYDMMLGARKLTYHITLNSESTESSSTPYSNYSYIYNIPEDRDKKYEELKSLLECTGKIRFISNRK